MSISKGKDKYGVVDLADGKIWPLYFCSNNEREHISLCMTLIARATLSIGTERKCWIMDVPTFFSSFCIDVSWVSVKDRGVFSTSAWFVVRRISREYWLCGIGIRLRCEVGLRFHRWREFGFFEGRFPGFLVSTFLRSFMYRRGRIPWSRIGIS